MRYLLALLLLFVLGCSTPMHSFSPVVTADGEHFWRIAYIDFDKEMLKQVISGEIGKHHLCPSGWVITNEAKLDGGYSLAEGKCR